MSSKRRTQAEQQARKATVTANMQENTADRDKQSEMKKLFGLSTHVFNEAVKHFDNDAKFRRSVNELLDDLQEKAKTRHEEPFFEKDDLTNLIEEKTRCELPTDHKELIKHLKDTIANEGFVSDGYSKFISAYKNHMDNFRFSYKEALEQYHIQAFKELCVALYKVFNGIVMITVMEYQDSHDVLKFILGDKISKNIGLNPSNHSPTYKTFMEDVKNDLDAKKINELIKQLLLSYEGGPVMVEGYALLKHINYKQFYLLWRGDDDLGDLPTHFFSPKSIENLPIVKVYTEIVQVTFKQTPIRSVPIQPAPIRSAEKPVSKRPKCAATKTKKAVDKAQKIEAISPENIMHENLSDLSSGEHDKTQVFQENCKELLENWRDKQDIESEKAFKNELLRTLNNYFYA